MHGRNCMEMHRKKGRRTRRRAAVCICLLVAAVLLIRGRNAAGELLLPEQKQELPEVVYFMQRHPAWAGDHLGQAKDTMASSGCLVCALAAGLDMQAIALEMDFYMTAGELNKAFSEADAYTEQGAVIWDRIKTAVPGTESYVAGSVETDEIDLFLSQGIFPVVKVRMGGYGAYHWVLLVGTDENGYLCMDPMSEKEAPVSLSVFGNRAYAVRAVYFCGK